MAAGLHSRGLTIPDLQRRITGLGEPPFMAKLSQVLSAAAFKLTMDTFKTSTDPYGNPWRPLRSRVGKPLLKTGRMRGSTYFNPLPNGFLIKLTAEYAAHHQYGTTRRAVRRRGGRDPRTGRFRTRTGRMGGLIPQRQMIPMAETGGLPPRWIEVFNRDTDALVRRALRTRTA